MSAAGRGRQWLFLPATLLALAAASSPAAAAADDRTIGADERSRIVDSLAVALEEYYVFPDVADSMATTLRARERRGAYDGLTSLFDFAQRLTSDLQEVSDDGHLRVRFRADEFFEPLAEDSIAGEERRARIDDEAYENFGFLRVERLRGNVGYIQMNGFHDARYAGPTAAAAMAFVGHSDAVLFDLRLTLGGSPTMEQLLTGFLFDEPTELSAFHRRRGDDSDVKQFWSSPYAPGADLSGADVYVLTSSQTPSAAEAFAYDLQQSGRATVVGDTTAGAAHPSSAHVFPALNLEIMIPFGRPVNPVSGTDWEGVGVIPDVAVPADDALGVAHALALEKILARTPVGDRRMKVEWAYDWVKHGTDPRASSEEELRPYEGTFGTLRFWIEDGALRYRRGEGNVYRLSPIGGDVFLFDDLYYVRVRFERDGSGDVVEAVTLSEEGPLGRYAKDR